MFQIRFSPCSLRVWLVSGLLVAPVFGRHSVAEEADKQHEPEITFEDQVLPLLRSKCLQCHGGSKPRGGLDLSRPEGLLIGGKSGPAIRVGAAEYSLMYERVASNEMPLDAEPLSSEEKGLIRTWLNQGAKGIGTADSLTDAKSNNETDWWSFQPPQRPEVPADVSAAHPIDAFVLKRLREAGLSMASPATRTELIRRASFDLTGLPPSPDQVRSFLEDNQPQAYERLIDQLLSSPHYGERWGRHWLDVAGYADSAGILNEDRPLPLAYRYRDYVIRAINADRPYDRFLQEQLAGDELYDYWAAWQGQRAWSREVVEGITATGFVRTAADPSRPDFKTIKNAAALYYYPTLNDTLQIVASATMGLTLHCARCHDHEFDPISQFDYYRMQAIFAAAYRTDSWVPQMERRLWATTEAQKQAADAKNKSVEDRIAELQQQHSERKSSFADRLFEERLKEFADDLQQELRAAFAEDKKDRTTRQQDLVKKHQPELRPDGESLDKALQSTFEEYEQGRLETERLIGEQNRQRVYLDEIRALYDLPGERVTHLLLRGDPLTPGPPVEPGVLTAVQAPVPFQSTPPETPGSSTGRRLGFARWLTQPKHPLTSRVMVNRIWLHHFGVGLVATPDDFGLSGELPSHPELLDWLAIRFVESGWSWKQMHRLMMTSQVYRQSSRVADDQMQQQADPENRLLWKQRFRRLEAEPIRDALLAVSGSLESSMFGAPSALQRHASGEVTCLDERGKRRRSVYLQVLRLLPHTMMELFDQPAMAVNCVQRMESTVAPQALTLLNSRQLASAAETFAAKVLRDAPQDPIGEAVLRAYSRPATTSEREVLCQFLKQQTARYEQENENAGQLALTDVCHMLLCSNEFVYID